MGPLNDMDAETVEDLLDVLQDVVLWRLTEHRWMLVQQALDDVAVALAATDPADLRDALVSLQLSGPVRALRIGSVDTVGVPDPVLDRQNTLVHALVELRGPRSRGPAADPKEEGRGDEPARRA
ncbi:CATRA system-associated protein [Dactylosporangium sp. AC04546]|uniref:CATRA system-associated protein n=1 Tax=Dactylosporangium sp. AC04546 TaxID=2862460 RepID=UPI001EE149D3|nr:CATRA system-associated protein [Dactylosporangium sp. AC04546]WVK88660.1 CATRA system-associated protein [Dactylosporangium sp. AC04546]